MNWFERWFLKHLLAKQVRQGYDHFQHINELYSMIRVAVEHEFVEDNQLTIDDVLRRQFESTQRIDRYKFPVPHVIKPIEESDNGA